jgi:ribosomal protein S18 acetylase RimI-like enzyme
MSNADHSLKQRIGGCLLGAAAGSLCGRFVEHQAWRQSIETRANAAGTFPADAAGLAWGEHGIDFNSHMLAVCRAVLEYDGRPAVEDLARVWLRSAEPLAFGDGEITLKPPANPVRYAMRNVFELLTAGTPPRIVGSLNVPMTTGIYVVPAAAAVNACDPEQAYLDAVRLASLFQRDRGTIVPGILAAMAAEALRPGATPGSVLDTASRTAASVSRLRPGLEPVETPAFLVAEARRAGRHATSPVDVFVRTRHLVAAYNRRDPWKILALAVGCFAFAGDDPEQAVETGALDPQSPDFLGGCCGLLCGALHGTDALPPPWLELLDSLRGGTELRRAGTDLAALAVEDARRRLARSRSLLFEVRPMAPDEIDRVCEVDREAFLNSRYGEMTARRKLSDDELRTWQSVQGFRAYCAAHPDRVLVAVDGGEIAGFATLDVDEEKQSGKVMNCAVLPAYRGRGIGVALVRRLLCELRSRGIRLARVTTSHVPEACRMYEKAGFRLTLRRLDQGDDGTTFYTSKYELELR